ncbi:MAG: efflux RND transporter periplasmic adaptor subunit [Magnetococcales bacterium]|nr:efflux RND transporter periplasmic adaptor subunit [Magnetococcales bacterium]
MKLRYIVNILFLSLFISPSLSNAAEQMAKDEVRGLLEPSRRAVLSSQVAAVISRLPLKEGEWFRKGRHLVTFDCGLYEARLQSARAALMGAEKTLTNNQDLARLNSVGRLEVSLSEAEVAQRLAEVAQAEIPVNRCVIKAPFDGRVVARMAQRYEYIQLGQPVLEVLDRDNPEVSVVVPSHWLAWLRVGAGFSMRVDETGLILKGKIIRLGAQVDPVSQSMQITGKLTEIDKTLVPGMSGSVHFDHFNTQSGQVAP